MTGNARAGGQTADAVHPPGDVLVIFVKRPEAGKVKTRLASALDAATALGLYRCFVEDTLDMAGKAGVPVAVAYHPPDALGDMVQWLGDGYLYLPQEGDDLGERMERVFRVLFERGTERAVMIGTDIPDLPANIVRQAFESLATRDAVIAPSADGGYYLIGFRREGFLRDAFWGISWSTPAVFRDTIAVFERFRTKVATLPVWRDVDDADGLAALVERNRAGSFGGSRTMSFMRKRGLIGRVSSPAK